MLNSRVIARWIRWIVADPNAAVTAKPAVNTVDHCVLGGCVVVAKTHGSNCVLSTRLMKLPN